MKDINCYLFLMDKYAISSAKSVGKRLKWLRRYHDDMTQVEFASSIGVEQGKYSNWERGSQRLSLEGALRIVEIYNVTLDFLYVARTDTLSHKMAIDFSSSPEASEASKSTDMP